MIRITVFTPTYNRAYILGNLYQSLKKQTFVEFEWVIVDDGSTDNTAEMVDSWISENNIFLIRYYYQENGGKHRAINKGLSMARGEIFFVMDSDDTLTDDALSKIDKWFREIADNPAIKGIVANRGYSANNTPNAFFQERFLDKSLLDMNTYSENGQKVLSGERAIAFYTDFHKQYLYPEYNNENFMTEAVVYNRMAHDGNIMRFYNDIIWIYEYREDGLSSNGIEIYVNNPYGYGLWVKEQTSFLNYSFAQKIRAYYSFYCDLREKHSIKQISKCIDAPIALMWLFSQYWNIKRLVEKRKISHE